MAPGAKTPYFCAMLDMSDLTDPIPLA